MDDNNYKLYEEYDNAANKYYLCIPNSGNNDEYQIYCGLSSDNISQENRINDINNICKRINKDGKNIVYIDTLVEFKKLMEASSDNDQRLYNVLLDIVHETISHAFGILNKNGDKKISNVITMVKKNEDDTKFIDWLEINLPMLINSASLVNNIRNDDTTDEDDTAPIVGSSEEETLQEEQNKKFTKRKAPKKNNHGFANIVLITFVLIILFVIGIVGAYILIK